MVNKRRNKKWIKIIFSILAILFIGYFLIHSIVKNQIEKVLSKKNLVSNLTISYEDLDLNLFWGNLSLDRVTIASNDSMPLKSTLKVKKLEIKGFGYFEMLRVGNYKIDALLLENVTGVYAKNSDLEKDRLESKKVTFDKQISIGNISFKNTNFTHFSAENDSVLLRIKDLNLTIDNLQLDATSIQNKIPFTYSDYQINSGKINASVSDFETIEIDSLYSNEKLYIDGFSLTSKYDKQTLTRKLTKERDYINLTIPTIEITAFNIVAYNDSSLVKAKAVLVKKLRLDMYRNKLLPDDLEQKLLLDKIVRNLSFKIDIPVINIEEGNIIYAELVEENTQAGEINFTELYSEIENISNINENPIVFKNTARLMGDAPIAVNWSFYTEANQNLFKASGSVNDFNTKKINSFMSSNLRAKSNGTIQELYFTISGDTNVSSGDIKMKYEDFSFQVLNKDRTGVNKLLTAVGNIFTNDGSKADEQGYRYGKIETERDATKSFFNYLWKNVSDGLVSTLTGNGEKEK